MKKPVMTHSYMMQGGPSGGGGGVLFFIACLAFWLMFALLVRGPTSKHTTQQQDSIRIAAHFKRIDSAFNRYLYYNSAAWHALATSIRQPDSLRRYEAFADSADVAFDEYKSLRDEKH